MSDADINDFIIDEITVGEATHAELAGADVTRTEVKGYDVNVNFGTKMNCTTASTGSLITDAMS